MDYLFVIKVCSIGKSVTEYLLYVRIPIYLLKNKNP